MPAPALPLSLCRSASAPGQCASERLITRPPCTWSSGQARGVGPSRAASALPGTCHDIGGALLAEPVWAGPLVRTGPGAATADSKGRPHVVPTGFNIDAGKGGLEIGRHNLPDRGQKRLYLAHIRRTRMRPLSWTGPGDPI